MENIQQPIAPVKHTGTSATLHTAAGAGVGAIKGWAKWGIAAFAACVVIGGIIGSGGLAGIGLGLSSGAWLGILGGGVAGLFVAPAASAVGALSGGAKGGSKAHQQVKLEKASAQAMDMQFEAYKYSALAQAAQAGQNTTVYAPTAANYTLPQQGSAMNQAMPQIGGGVQYDGAIAGQQLQRA